MDKRYPDLRSLLLAADLSAEYDDTRPVIAALAHVREQGFFTHAEFMQMCCWKEKRQRKRRYWLENTEEDVQAISRRAFATESEGERMAHLDMLKGVACPSPQRS